MRVPGIIYADESLIRDMDLKVYEQVVNVATLPGIVQASFAMPDAHWGYGFPIGGVAAFDPQQGGVVSAGGVGFDISCGVRALYTSLRADDITPVKEKLADLLFAQVPAGVGSTGRLHLKPKEMDDMLTGGAQWAVHRGYGTAKDLSHIEEHGCMTGAKPAYVSDQAKKRQQDEMGTLGSGNHYLEIQEVVETYHEPLPEKLGIHSGDILVSIHCGSRGLGHQIGTEYLKKMVVAASRYGITLPDRELACAPIDSPLGQEYLGAMRAAINCALANREIVTHLVRQAFSEIFPQMSLPLLYDVSHNTCKMEEHQIGGRSRRVFVHRKGATRAFGPGHAAIPPDLQAFGQPVLIGGTMG
ncbi:MAG: RtcB family protein, partial [Nitrospirales bacterium]|nr:RtcB family protein [Nitrospirales bacterium]